MTGTGPAGATVGLLGPSSQLLDPQRYAPDFGAVVEQERERELAKSVGIAIAKARAAAGLTQDDLAEALQMGSTAVSRIERGTVMVSLPRLVEIAEILHQPLEMLLRKGSDLDTDYAISIATTLAPLRKADKDLITAMVETLAGRLKEDAR